VYVCLGAEWYSAGSSTKGHRGCELQGCQRYGWNWMQQGPLQGNKYKRVPKYCGTINLLQCCFQQHAGFSRGHHTVVLDGAACAAMLRSAGRARCRCLLLHASCPCLHDCISMVCPCHQESTHILLSCPVLDQGHHIRCRH
jgi:hypothetical protein